MRGNISIQGPNAIVTASKVVTEFDQLARESSNGSEESLRITFPKFDTTTTPENMVEIKPENSVLLQINSHGEPNHSGSTPPAKRKDAVLGLANLILALDALQKNNPELGLKLHGLATPKWGANQIQDNASLILEIPNEELLTYINAAAVAVQDEHGTSFDINRIESAKVNPEPNTSLFVDVRQQYPATGKNSEELLFNRFQEAHKDLNSRNDSISLRITSIGDPVKMNSDMLADIQRICQEKNYPCTVMHSWPGHDLACVFAPNNKKGNRVLFFIPSTGGSHNPNESTTREAIDIGTDVYSSLVASRMDHLEKQYETQKEKQLGIE